MNDINKKDLLQIANFIEELSWLIKSKKNISLENMSNTIRNIYFDKAPIINLNKDSSFEVKRLVGILPFLFQDKDLFSTNKDIIEFAENLFGIYISRHDKRSRYELIGLIVTEIAKLKDNNNIIKVIDTLSELTNDNEKLSVIKKEKKNIDFSWNETINKLNINE